MEQGFKPATHWLQDDSAITYCKKATNFSINFKKNDNLCFGFSFKDVPAMVHTHAAANKRGSVEKQRERLQPANPNSQKNVS